MRLEPTAELFASALEGDPLARDALFRVIYPRVLAYAKARLGGYRSATVTPEDIAQEVFMALLTWGGTDHGGEVMAQVFSIARNKIVDVWRRPDRSIPTDEPLDTVEHRDPEWHALRAADAQRVRDLLSGLRPDYRKVVWLRLALDASAEETATALGISSGSVRVIQHRALADLRGETAAPRPLTKARCGTYSGYMRHLRAKEQVCVDCRTAMRVYKRSRCAVA